MRSIIEGSGIRVESIDRRPASDCALSEPRTASCVARQARI